MVYRCNWGESRQFPGSEVVRVCLTSNPDEYLDTLYKQNIAYCLYPDNILKLLGGNQRLVTPNFFLTLFVRLIEQLVDSAPSPAPKQKFEYRLYSRLANVPPEHAHFGATMIGTDEDGHLIKDVPSCPCKLCTTHLSFHSSANTKHASDVVDQISRAGIFLPDPIFDPSDWCLTPQGIPFFFELEGLDPRIIYKHLTKQKNPTRKEKLALSLLGHYQTIKATRGN